VIQHNATLVPPALQANTIHSVAPTESFFVFRRTMREKWGKRWGIARREGFVARLIDRVLVCWRPAWCLCGQAGGFRDGFGCALWPPWWGIHAWLLLKVGRQAKKWEVARTVARTSLPDAKWA